MMTIRDVQFTAPPAICGKILGSGAITAVALLSAELDLDGAGGQKGTKPMIPDNSYAIQAAEQVISRWLDATRLPAPRDYLEIHDFHELADAVGVEQNSLYWAGKFFRSAANPHRQVTEVRRSIHRATPDTFDVLRHEYSTGGKRLVVQETVNLILVTLDQPLDDLLARDEGGKQDEIEKIAELVLNMSGTMVATNLQDAPYRWIFRFPSTIQEGARFSTDSSQNPRRMWSWANRLDGGIHSGRLYFLCFKQRESTSGKIMTPDAQHWFDGKSWAAFQR